MNIATPIGAIVKENFNTSLIFAQLGIDFCCGGKVSLEEACTHKGLDPMGVLKQLEAAEEKGQPINYDGLSAQSLIHQIMQVHHKYIATTAPAIQMYLKKLVARHGENHPELIEIDGLFDEAFLHLTDHMKKEEMILFPYVEAMEEAQIKGFALAAPHFGHIDHPITVMEGEHQEEGDRFKRIAELSNNYQVPEDGCQTYAVTYALLQEFQMDLHTHVHLENNILFPKAKQLFTEQEKTR